MDSSKTHSNHTKKDKKKLMISIIIIIGIIVVSIIGYHGYQQQQTQKKIDEMIVHIEKAQTDFDNHKNREDKLASLQSLSKEHTDYENSQTMIDEIDQTYHDVISHMQKVFTDEYQQILTNNTLKDISKIKDTKQLNNAKAKLNQLLQTIQNEKDVMISNESFTDYQTKIKTLTQSYDDQITAIKKEEKRKEEQKKKEAQQNASQSRSQSSSQKSNQSSSKDKSKGRYIVKWRKWTDEYGTTYTYWYSDGSIWFKEVDGSMHDITNNPDIWG